MENATGSRRTEDQKYLQASLNLVAPVAGELVASFYDQLFSEYPQLRSMFPPVMDLQRERLLKAIIALVTHYDDPDTLLPVLQAMGTNHNRYGVRIDHYAAVGLTLLDTLSRFAGDAWTREVAGAWERAYTFAAGAMMQAGAIASRPATVPVSSDGRVAA
jgi:hemoglobin-like flavoprotein